MDVFRPQASCEQGYVSHFYNKNNRFILYWPHRCPRRYHRPKRHRRGDIEGPAGFEPGGAYIRPTSQPKPWAFVRRKNSSGLELVGRDSKSPLIPGPSPDLFEKYTGKRLVTNRCMFMLISLHLLDSFLLIFYNIYKYMLGANRNPAACPKLSLPDLLKVQVLAEWIKPINLFH